MSSCFGKFDTDMILDGFEYLIEDVANNSFDVVDVNTLVGDYSEDMTIAINKLLMNIYTPPVPGIPVLP